MGLDVKEIQKQHIFHNKSFRQIGEELGVTKQYLSFMCKKHRNNPEQVLFDLLNEFEQQKDSFALNERIRIKRRLKNLTQKDVAQEVGTHASVITRIENGELKHTVFEQRLADYLEV
mgnify:CR=1 FL=1|jgi:ribosome-binding protein aMBF1 (putative translation factor)|tara:strand:- start:17 stop:367 length:351 start_codon:yes stop_codon:yes gene_type:complete